MFRSDEVRGAKHHHNIFNRDVESGGRHQHVNLLSLDLSGKSDYDTSSPWTTFHCLDSSVARDIEKCIRWVRSGVDWVSHVTIILIAMTLILEVCRRHESPLRGAKGTFRQRRTYDF